VLRGPNTLPLLGFLGEERDARRHLSTVLNDGWWAQGQEQEARQEQEQEQEPSPMGWGRPL
jgi:hypothetical protein